MAYGESTGRKEEFLAGILVPEYTKWHEVLQTASPWTFTYIPLSMV